MKYFFDDVLSYHIENFFLIFQYYNSVHPNNYNFYFCLKPAFALTAYIPLENQDKKNGELKDGNEVNDFIDYIVRTNK